MRHTHMPYAPSPLTPPRRRTITSACTQVRGNCGNTTSARCSHLLAGVGRRTLLLKRRRRRCGRRLGLGAPRLLGHGRLRRARIERGCGLGLDRLQGGQELRHQGAEVDSFACNHVQWAGRLGTGM